MDDRLGAVQWGLDVRDGSASGHPVAFLTGDVHSFNVHILMGLLLSYSRHEELVLDLSGIHRFSPAAVETLVAGADLLRDAGCRLILRHPSRTVLAVLDASETRSRFFIVEPFDTALLDDERPHVPAKVGPSSSHGRTTPVEDADNSAALLPSKGLLTVGRDCRERPPGNWLG